MSSKPNTNRIEDVIDLPGEGNWVGRQVRHQGIVYKFCSTSNLRPMQGVWLKVSEPTSALKKFVTNPFLRIVGILILLFAAIDIVLVAIPAFIIGAIAAVVMFICYASILVAWFMLTFGLRLVSPDREHWLNFIYRYNFLRMALGNKKPSDWRDEPKT